MADAETTSSTGRELTQAEVYALKDARQMEARWNSLVDRVKAIPDIDHRQLAIAVAEAEAAFMRMARAITRPERRVEASLAATTAALHEAGLARLEGTCAVHGLLATTPIQGGAIGARGGTPIAEARL